jgi:hypothetical protein
MLAVTPKELLLENVIVKLTQSPFSGGTRFVKRKGGIFEIATIRKFLVVLSPSKKFNNSLLYG